MRNVACPAPDCQKELNAILRSHGTTQPVLQRGRGARQTLQGLSSGKTRCKSPGTSALLPLLPTHQTSPPVTTSLAGRSRISFLQEPELLLDCLSVLPAFMETSLKVKPSVAKRRWNIDKLIWFQA